MRKILLLIFAFSAIHISAQDSKTDCIRKIFSANQKLTEIISANISENQMPLFLEDIKSIKSPNQLTEVSERYLTNEKAGEYRQYFNALVNDLNNLSAMNITDDEIKNAVNVIVDEMPRFPCKNVQAYDDCMSGVYKTLAWEMGGAITAGFGAGATWFSYTGEPISSAVAGIGWGIFGMHIASNNFGKAQGDCYKTHCEGSSGQGPGMPSGGIPKSDTTAH